MNLCFIPIKKLENEPYSTIIGYPKATKRQIKSRVSELEKLKVKSIAFTGPTTVNNLEILGKGYVGVVVLAKKARKKIALKIRRTDSQRKEMRNESILLKEANNVNVGPKILDSSKNFILMEYLDGSKISDWINELKGKGSSEKLRSIIRQILEDCYRLDQIGFDHGELSNISKHVIVTARGPVLIDFESSSTKRRVANVTSATQAIFIGSGISKKVNHIYKTPKKNDIIQVLREYKYEQTRESFDKLLEKLRLLNLKLKFDLKK